MPRRYYPRRSYGSRDKYSIQQNTFRLLLTPQAPQNNIVCVPDTTTEGMRKVKHLTISLGNITGSGVIYWALIFVPSGYSPNSLNLPTQNSAGNLYEPNQFVMNCGCIDIDAGPCRISSPIARNLNAGDSIHCLLGSPGLAAQIDVTGIVKYAITLQ